MSLYNFYSVLLFRSSELDLPYPDLTEYIGDMNVMMALIINGPVWVLLWYHLSTNVCRSVSDLIELSLFPLWWCFTGSLSATAACSTWALNSRCTSSWMRWRSWQLRRKFHTETSTTYERQDCLCITAILITSIICF